MPNVKIISDVLEAYGKSVADKTPTLNDGKSLDIKALQELDETKAVIKTLKELGVKKRGWLLKNGFVPAGMILVF